MHFRVLLVDDQPLLRSGFDRVLRMLGCRVTSVATVAQARVAMESTQFDLILSDLDLGVGSGLDVLEYARRAHPQARRALMSGIADLETMVERTSGRVEFLLEKPVTLPTLQKLFRSLPPAPRPSESPSR
jgi:DNA-binding NtrC family response regulator